MPTSIADVVKSPVAANVLTAAGIETAEAAAALPDSALRDLRNVGPAAIAHIRAWQLAQDPPIPVPAEPIGAEEVRRLRSSRFDTARESFAAYLRLNPPPVEAAQLREERIRALAERIFRELVVIDVERNLPVDFAGLRDVAYQAAESFYPAPPAPSEP
jgi:hypothetical protein